MTSDGVAEVTEEMSASLAVNPTSSVQTTVYKKKIHNSNELDGVHLLERKDFLFLEELGEGSFSTVFLVSEKSTKNKFAIKVCYKAQIIREKKVFLYFFLIFVIEVN